MIGKKLNKKHFLLKFFHVMGGLKLQEIVEMRILWRTK